MTTPDPPDLRRVIDAIDGLSDGLEDAKGRLQSTDDTLRTTNRKLATTNEELAKAGKRSWWSLVAGGIGILVGIIGVIYGVNAKATTDDINDSRRESRVGSCVQANANTKATREALVAGVAVLALPNPERGMDAQQRLDEFVANYSKAVEAKLPYRDCSEAGITRFFEHPPADPNKEA